MLLVVKVLLDLLDQKVLMGHLVQKETRALKGPLVPLVIKDKKDSEKKDKKDVMALPDLKEKLVPRVQPEPMVPKATKEK